MRKIVFVLEQARKPLRSPEIIEELAKREEHLRNHWNQAQYFSAFLNKAVKEERIKQEKRRGEKCYYYYSTNEMFTYALRIANIEKIGKI